MFHPLRAWPVRAPVPLYLESVSMNEDPNVVRIAEADLDRDLPPEQ